jgi:hypothetical protein
LRRNRRRAGGVLSEGDFEKKITLEIRKEE